MRFIVLCVILITPAVNAVPPKARVVTEPQQTAKAPANPSSNSAVKREKATTPKVVAARPVQSKGWRWVPKFQKTGKQETLWGLFLKRPF
jgi:N-acetylmuramoyl-L-alanine amidase CwlA